MSVTLGSCFLGTLVPVITYMCQIFGLYKVASRRHSRCKKTCAFEPVARRERERPTLVQLIKLNMLGRRLKISIVFSKSPSSSIWDQLVPNIIRSSTCWEFCSQSSRTISHLLQQYPDFEWLNHSDSECSSDNDFVLESFFNWSFCGVPKKYFQKYFIRITYSQNFNSKRHKQVFPSPCW